MGFFQEGFVEGKDLWLASKESAAIIMASASSFSFSPTWRRVMKAPPTFIKPLTGRRLSYRAVTGTWNLDVISFWNHLHLSLVVGLDMLVADLFERAVENRRLTTMRTALLQQEQESEEEIVLQERQGSPSLQEEHNLDILSSPLCHLK